MINAGLFSRSGGAIPLLGVEVSGEVLGAHARVIVRQRYRNDESRPVEAVYTFPLPADATLAGFAMTADGRRVEGEVREREEAFRKYDDALVAGHGAALLEQERPNVFTASVGNLLPGEETLVEVEYVQRLAADEGALRWMIPTLVAPRYIPGTPSGDRTGHGSAGPTDRVPDADRITPRAGQVDYGLALDLLFDLGRDVLVESPSHALAVRNEGHGRVRVRFAQREVALDRDVVITARSAPGAAAGNSAQSSLATLSVHRDEATGEGAFALAVVPDLYEFARRGVRQEVVFVIDTSGSMEGDSIREARAALRLCLRHLREGDRFNVIAFNNSYRKYAPEPVVFTQATLAGADRWVEALVAAGGTEILQPTLDALRGLRGNDGVVVLLTDGQVGNEDEILRAVRDSGARARVYSFGIGTNVSDALLRGLARDTGGAVEFIHPGERIDEKVVAQFGRALSPRVSGLEVKFHGVDAGELAPGELPAMVDGDPWVVYGRYESPGRGRAEIRGTVMGEKFVLEVPLDFPTRSERPALLKLWASERVRDLEASALSGRRAEAMRDRIVKLAVKYGVSSRYTSFVVVEKRTGDRRASGQPETRVVPVNLPAGWTMFDRNPVDAIGGGVHMNKTKAGMFPPGMPVPRVAATGRARSGAAGAPPAMAPPPPPPPQGAMPADTRKGGDVLFSLKALEEEQKAGLGGRPPVPATMDAPADGFADDTDYLMEAQESAAAAPKAEAAPERGKRSLLERAKDLFAPAPAPAQAPARSAPAPAKPAPASHGVGADPVVSLLGRQLASGLWDEPGATGEDELRRVRATARALLELLRAGVTTAHPLHGTQVRKAIEALVTTATHVAPRDAAAAELSLGVAWLCATGRRTRGEIEAAVARTAPLASLAARFGDERALREHVERGFAMGS